ncbi:MAG: hypothetical protein LC132_02005 [Burkholderiales bacterium]|jgi:hypothetical protein|nr:hypothetical protein [Burkholderiales bacterium]
MNKRQLSRIINGAIKVKELAQASGDPGIKKQAKAIYEITRQLIKAQGHKPKK